MKIKILVEGGSMQPGPALSQKLGPAGINIGEVIKKVNDAKKNNEDTIEVWGDGSASREFLYVNDAAKAIVLATQNYDGKDPVNIGAGFEITIRELVLKICKLMNFEGKIIFDTSKPNGQPRRCLDTSKAKEFGFKASTDFEDGLKETIDWYYTIFFKVQVKGLFSSNCVIIS